MEDYGISQETMDALYADGISLAAEVAFRIIGALLFYFIGRAIVKKVLKTIARALEKRDDTPSLNEFLNSFSKILLYFILFVGVLMILGVPGSSFLAVFGAAGLAIGLALQGSLSNFAGGLLILAFKPFKVGHVIVAQGHTGTVARVQVLYTHLMTFDNQEVIIPNGNLANSDIINMSTQETRRAELKVGVAYGTNIKQAKEIILNIFENDPRALKDPAPFVALSNFGDSSLDIVVRVWAKSADMWPMYFDGMEAINTEFEKHGIEIPFPQRVVHQIQEKADGEG
ncbi:mechanosensitive ion channel [Algoriphagus halophytocola]|uniref:Mechanosensitive ion channel n=1 Tax=Algoriphagus halophytocola TaxID=2991499 RepID=A0ABY6MHU8_9BACT|nr:MULTISPECIES: mechanosensitive ion channel domain-containing protein [unclassified Algoriphagus]UZD21759.1 mechanosensitive ion channel [Algoriphagus sp. TR-M5]WBL42971.1 mechanosensitive ion channel [Algoriphagus sp. TR-M9]